MVLLVVLSELSAVFTDDIETVEIFLLQIIKSSLEAKTSTLVS